MPGANGSITWLNDPLEANLKNLRNRFLTFRHGPPRHQPDQRCAEQERIARKS